MVEKKEDYRRDLVSSRTIKKDDYMAKVRHLTLMDVRMVRQAQESEISVQSKKK